VYLQKNTALAYLDSVENVMQRSPNLSDSMYYSSQLMELYKAIGNTTKENHYLQINNAVFNKFNTPQSIREAKEKMAKMEVAAVEAKQKAEADKAQSRKLIIYLLAALLAAIASFTYFLNKKNKQAKITNQQLLQKNQQNELLNKEIHHRVKNNLEMIASLVYMQERNSDTEEVKQNMQNISLRIESIANLHQQLMEQADEVDLKKYIQHLVANVTNVLADNKNVHTYLDIQPLAIPQKISFPLGLIINEWITNSVKYAVPTNTQLSINIEISNGNNQIKVIYFDNGKPQTTKPSKKSLGLDIVTLLTAQLKAITKNKPENIFYYHLTIPINNGN
jgi:two-component sensor histidine kinase